jgi:hypothetical protein
MSAFVARWSKECLGTLMGITYLKNSHVEHREDVKIMIMYSPVLTSYFSLAADSTVASSLDMDRKSIRFLL